MAIAPFIRQFANTDRTWFDGALSTSQIVAAVAGAAALVLLVTLRGRRAEVQPTAPGA